ncbi:hypothetical protein ACMA1D_10800 [Streptomyces sp. 796.1]|uniref:hypothetical protein n=1 Tax=Streptomyces sp. 796.1 TaxID=3163029 RepID=UPI0039C99B6D
MTGGWDNFADEVAAQSTRHYQRCGVAILLDELPNDQARAAVRAALDSDHVTSAGLARVLRQRCGDIAPSGNTIGRHRGGNCTCRKEPSDEQ